ncbi:MAG: ABC transporter substrate binding protein [Bryobacteraceae bacterium]
MLSRRSMLAMAAAVGSEGFFVRHPLFGSGQAKQVTVIFPSTVEPCAEAADALKFGLSSSSVDLQLLDLNNATFAAAVNQAMTHNPSVIVGVGSDAVRAMLTRTTAARTVSTMTLETDRIASLPAAHAHAAVYLDIPVRSLVTEVRKLFPARARIGIIRNPNRGLVATAQMHSPGTDPNLVEIAECRAPEELLPAFLGLRKKVDFVICLPDGTLYNGATARPLIMASLENRLPIVGFSPAFLRAGAAIAIYPDYRGVGLQTADVVRRCLEPGDCNCSENAKKLTVAVNAKVLRLLGVDFNLASHPDAVVVR